MSEERRGGGVINSGPWVIDDCAQMHADHTTKNWESESGDVGLTGQTLSVAPRILIREGSKVGHIQRIASVVLEQSIQPRLIRELTADSGRSEGFNVDVSTEVAFEARRVVATSQGIQPVVRDLGDDTARLQAVEESQLAEVRTGQGEHFVGVAVSGLAKDWLRRARNAGSTREICKARNSDQAAFIFENA